jgi:tetratricopeptide (TPR) repeat protein
MPEPETPRSIPQDERSATAAAPVDPDEVEVDDAFEPEPEPMTPERVLIWNAYYDKYVLFGTLLLVFVVSANKVTQSSLWTHLKTGQLILEQRGPITTDPFSYTETGQRWVNIPWLFQASHAALYRLVYDLVPTDPADPTANARRAEHLAVGVLVGLSALVRVVTALLLLRIRRAGPGLWWSALCVTLAIGVFLSPGGLALGGIASPGTVAPPNWGMLLLAAELLLLHRAFLLGRSGSLMGLIPLFLIWANIDESFLFGLMILFSSTVGMLLDRRFGTGRPAAAPVNVKGAPRGVDPAAQADLALNFEAIRPSTAVAVVAACFLVVLANPSTFRVYGAAFEPFLQLFQPAGGVVTQDQLGFFSQGLREQLPDDWWLATAYYLVVVAIGLGSFLLNAPRFLWSRFLPFAAASLVWGVYMRFAPEFSIVFAPVLALNGQEWYLDTFGAQGRMGWRWSLWSTGGRLVTLTLLFGCVSKAITGWNVDPNEPTFGFDFNANDFAFEASEFLARNGKIQGNVLNTTLSEGDALIWKAYPVRSTFIDGRRNLYSRDLLEKLQSIRLALSEDDVETWRPALDEYKISVVMIEMATSRKTYGRLMQSPNWIPFYDDGRVVMFGRADAPEEDLAEFRENRLDPEQRAYKVSHPVATADRPPTPTSWIDDIFQSRVLARPQWRTDAGRRWLQGPDADASNPEIPDPARCLLAIQDARAALAGNPDDWSAYRLLAASYGYLMAQETALLSGISLTPQNRDQIAALPPNLNLLMNRFRQRVTALNNAIQTTPTPRTSLARMELLGLNRELARLYILANYVDLARDRLQACLELMEPDDPIADEERSQFRQEFEQLDQRVEQIKENLEQLVIEQQANPIQQASYALSQGAPGLALIQLEEAERSSMSPAIVKPQLIDLYCNTGQYDRALDLLSVGAVEDPNLGTEPGTAAMRQGLVYFLMGNYHSAASLWEERAIPRLRFDRAFRVLNAAQALTLGEAVATTDGMLSIPTSIGQQASWEFDLGLCRLEAGLPELAAKHFTQSLTLAPDLAVRPIAAYYLERIGEPVPPPGQGTSSDTGAAARNNAGSLVPTIGAGPTELLPSASPATAPATAPTSAPAQEPTPPANPTAPAAADNPAKP